MNSKELLEQANEKAKKLRNLADDISFTEDTIPAIRDNALSINGYNVATHFGPDVEEKLKQDILLLLVTLKNKKSAELEQLLGIKSVPDTVQDPVEEKLADILKAEAARIESPEDKSLGKYPPAKRKPKLSDDLLSEICRMYIDEGKTAKEIAEIYKVKPNDVNNFVAKHKLRRRSYDKSIGSKPELPKQPDEKESP